MLPPNLGVDGAITVVRRVYKQIGTDVFLEYNHRLRGLIGVAKLPDTTTTGEELIQALGDAIYMVKVDEKDGRRLLGAVSREGVTA